MPAALHVSAPLQALPSEQALPAGSGACLTPVAGSQLSVVHRLPSSTGGAVPPEQTPAPLQTSTTLHALSSEQDVPEETLAWLQVSLALHVSRVQTFGS